LANKVFHADIAGQRINSSLGSQSESRIERAGFGVLFKSGALPCHADWQCFADSFSDTFLLSSEASARPAHESQVGHWLELVRKALAFDVAPFDLDHVRANVSFDNPVDYAGSTEDLGKYESIQLLPGAHIAGGTQALPVVRIFMGLARDIVRHFDAVEAVLWPPGQSIIGRRYFESSVSAWIEHGLFPTNGLVTFRQLENGKFESCGLAYFIGQELQVDGSILDVSDGSNRGSSRLVNQLILSGGIDQPQSLIAPDGKTLRLHLSRDRRKVIVR
jgi:hypothetical protein